MAQLVERHLAKVEVAGSSPVSRSFNTKKTSKWMSFFVLKSTLIETGRPITAGVAGRDVSLFPSRTHSLRNDGLNL